MPRDRAWTRVRGMISFCDGAAMNVITVSRYISHLKTHIVRSFMTRLMIITALGLRISIINF